MNSAFCWAKTCVILNAEGKGRRRAPTQLIVYKTDKIVLLLYLCFLHTSARSVRTVNRDLCLQIAKDVAKSLVAAAHG